MSLSADRHSNSAAIQVYDSADGALSDGGGALPALAPAEPEHVAAIPVQDRRPIKGHIMAKGEDEYAPGKALARMTEWPKRAPKSFSVVCYVTAALAAKVFGHRVERRRSSGLWNGRAGRRDCHRRTASGACQLEPPSPRLAG